ncbi:YdeI/OmpD-associated family protein [Amycolatopsis sp. NPDC101161]|uniref:YdeI/OmpD-associated family protein n=1 Tax=Amycolatopsis sp. NPDC101161 TaxID=3363940 RepID=UPI003825CB5D
MEFRTQVLLGGKTATGLPVPDAVVEALGAGKKPAVTVTLGGHTYRTTAGDEVDVKIPADLVEALAADDTARARFESLSYSAKQSAETRQRRVAKVITDLRAGK